jgi:hypothetical protein
MCDTQEMTTLLQALQNKQPDFFTLELSDVRDWKLDYRNYRYCYFWLPTVAYTLSFGDYGSGLVQPQIWTNLGFRPGTVCKTVGQPTPVTIHVQFSDWLVQ